MGNPPFQGGKRITGALGTSYRDYLVEYLAEGVRGNADLCAYFFLRAGHALRQNGQFGLVATNTIAQGDTREVGLDQMVVNGFSIPRAVPSRPWLGLAAVEVAYVWVRKSTWCGEYILNDQQVSGISALLTAVDKHQEKPNYLERNKSGAFIGSYVLGMGFVLSPEEAKSLIAKNPRNKEVVFPFLNGEDINGRLDQSPSRWVINFFDWPLERAESYSDCISIIRERAKPDRDKLGLKSDASAKGYARLWWQYARRGQELYTS